jgi:hypothetical protein
MHLIHWLISHITLSDIIRSVLLYIIVHPIIDILTRVYRYVNSLYLRSLRWMFKPFIHLAKGWYYSRQTNNSLAAAVIIEPSLTDQGGYSPVHFEHQPVHLGQ